MNNYNITYYPWLKKSYYQVLSCYKKAMGHHALLIHSQDSNDKELLFYALSRWLMCHQPNDIKSCDICHSCKLMIVGNHPDFYHLKLENGYQNLGIDNIRTIIDSIYIHPQQGRVKIFCIPNSELLTEQAGNALLKVLEEPPDKTFFLLGCRGLLHLLPTIKSRCLYWPLPIPNELLGINWLQQVGSYDLVVARTALRLCGGSPLSAKKLLQKSYWQERLRLCVILSESIVTGDMLSLLPVLNHNHNRDNGPLHWLLTLITDALKWQQDMQISLINEDNLQLVSALATRWTTNILHIQWQQWLRCLRLWQEVSGINHELILTNQLLIWEKQ